MRDDIACKRFGLKHGQFFAEYRFSNVHWILNDKEIGYGDLRVEDIIKIHQTLGEDDVFEGFNEHHMTHHMQRESPVVRIRNTSIQYPGAVPVSNETRIKIQQEGL